MMPYFSNQPGPTPHDELPVLKSKAELAGSKRKHSEESSGKCKQNDYDLEPVDKSDSIDCQEYLCFSFLIKRTQEKAQLLAPIRHNLHIEILLYII